MQPTVNGDRVDEILTEAGYDGSRDPHRVTPSGVERVNPWEHIESPGRAKLTCMLMRVRTRWSGVSALLVACTGAGEGRGEERAVVGAEVQRGRLEIALPPGFAVEVDGVGVGTTPLEAIEVEAGKHVVRVDSPCGAVSREVEVAGPAAAKVEAAELDGFALATLKVKATTLAGEEVKARVSVGSWALPEGAETIPACKLRLRVDAETLGGFIEDVEFAAGQSYTRAVVLRPGPDVVRLGGGPFVLGTPEADAALYREIEGQLQFRPLPKRVEIGAFELDRTEVTVRQWLECEAAGPCAERPKTFNERPRFAREEEEDQCVYAYITNEHRFTRRAAKGNEDRALNCISFREATRYCAWRGMRFPTTYEWEYAARGGRSDYRWPWGNEEPSCRPPSTQETFPQTPPCVEEGKEWEPTLPREPCSDPSTTSVHGVCDLADNLKEFAVVPRGEPHARWVAQAGGLHGPGEGFLFTSYVWGTDDDERWLYAHFAHLGFRCARSVGGGG